MDGTGLIHAADWVSIRRLRPENTAVVGALRRLSGAADDSRIWIGTAAVLAATGRPGRRSATEGLAAIAVSSALVNGPLKLLTRRSRPQGVLALGLAPRGRPPTTSSWPSGHAATAAAFATAAALRSPMLAAPLGAAALAVGWSRIVTARHFPTDVAAGVVIGAACGAAVHLAVDRLAARRHETPKHNASVTSVGTKP